LRAVVTRERVRTVPIEDPLPYVTGQICVAPFPIPRRLRSDEYEIGQGALRCAVAHTLGRALIDCVARVLRCDRPAVWRCRPRVDAMFVAPGSRVIPFGFGRQPSSIPYAEGERLVPSDAIDGARLVWPLRVSPCLKG
jgi:hypothetical protein